MPPLVPVILVAGDTVDSLAQAVAAVLRRRPAPELLRTQPPDAQAIEAALGGMPAGVAPLVVPIEPGSSHVGAALGLRATLGARGFRLSEVVTALDVSRFHHAAFGSGPDEDHDDDPFATAERLAVLAEVATTVVLVQERPAPRPVRSESWALVRALNPHAAVMGPDAAASQPAAVHRRTEGLGVAAGWQQHLRGLMPARSSEAIRVLVYREPRPFHPGRLATALEDEIGDPSRPLVLRSRGLTRLASRPDEVGSWSSLGPFLTFGPTAIPAFSSDSPIGQELVFFGLDLDVDALRHALDRCLLTDAELLGGPRMWRRFADPFPSWGSSTRR